MKRYIEWALMTFLITGSVFCLYSMNDYGVKVAIFITGGIVSLGLDSLYNGDL